VQIEAVAMREAVDTQYTRKQTHTCSLYLPLHVRIEAVAMRVVVDTWRNVGILRRKLDIKKKEAVGIGRILRALNHYLKQVTSVFVHHHVDVGR